MELYKRGNDYIDKDVLLRLLNKDNLLFYLDKTTLNKDLQQKVKEEFANLMAGIFDNTLSYNSVDGFNNNSSRYLINDPDPKKDYLGFAANFIYDTINKASSVKPDEQAIGKYILKNMFNSDEDYDIGLFKNLDYNDPTSITERSKYIFSVLDNVAGNYDTINLIPDEKRKTEWMSRYNKLRKDGVINKGNMLDLAWLTLIPDIDTWFATDEEKKLEETLKEVAEKEVAEKAPTAPPAAPPAATVLSVKKPMFLDIAINLNTNNKYNSDYVSKYKQYIKSLPDAALFTIVTLALSKKGFEISKTKGFPIADKLITNKDALNIILKTLYKRGSLTKYYGNNGLYYLNGTKNKSYGYVYEPSSNKVIARDTSNIPYFVTAKKQGGVIKALDGLNTKKLLFDNPDLFEILPPNPMDFSKFSEFPSLVLEISRTLSAAPQNTFEETSKSNPINFSKALAPDDVFADGTEDIYAATTWDDNFQLNYLDDKGNWQLRKRIAGAENTTDDKFYKPENYLGNTTGYKAGTYQSVSNFEKNDKRYNAFQRLLDVNDTVLERKLNDYKNKRGKTSDKQLMQYYDVNTQKWDLKGAREVLRRLMNDGKLGIAHDILLGSTYYIDGKPNIYFKNIPKGYKAVEGEEWDEDGLIRKIKLVKDDGSVEKPTSKSNISGKNGQHVGTNKPPYENLNIKKPWKDLLAWELLSAAKLPLALDTNARVAKLLKRTAPLVLENTYERLSPVTGAYNYMQMLNNQGANMYSDATRGKVSDYRLNALTQLNAKLANIGLREKGYLAHDNEIKRTADEALKRTEDNVLRRNSVFNKNMEAIANHNYYLGLIDANKLNSNYLSFSNTIDTFSNEWQKRYEDSQARYEYMYQLFLENRIANWKAKAMEKANQEFNDWNEANGGNKLITEWEYGTQYNNWKDQVNKMANQMRLKNMSALYGVKYNGAIRDELFDSFLNQDWKNPAT